MRRRDVTFAFLAGAIWPMRVRAQAGSQGQRVGFLHPGRSSVASLRALSVREGLVAEAGRGAPLELVTRMAEERTDQLPRMAAELMGLGVQAIVAVSPSAVHAAHAATKDVPIIAVDLESDPVGSGWAASLGRPGGNVTGIFLDLPELGAKCLQLLREIMPELATLGVLWDPATGSVPLEALSRVTAALGLAIQVREVTRAAEFEDRLRALAQGQRTGLLLLPSPLMSGNLQLLAELTLALRLPTITLFPDFAQRGGLVAYGPDLQALFRQAGAVTHKILAGANPAELPIERPARFQLAVNLKTALALGIVVPTSVLLLADEVIE
jgi:putative ABC transport system substrate-binding protein